MAIQDEITRKASLRKHPDYSTWRTKQQAADEIGVSTKTIEQFAKAGELDQATWKRPKGMPLAVFDPDGVTRIAHTRNPSKPLVLPVGRVVPASGNGHGAALVPVQSDSALEGMQDVKRLTGFVLDALRASQVYTKLFLTLEEAADVSGLPLAYLRRRVREGTLPAIKSGGWRIRRRDLEGL